ncbi:unnamed protein product [Closterium sp. NIES-64]|nr:unnamed protein product [Closterium sp. NIES-64]
MPPRAQSPRPASSIPPSVPPLFSARPFLLGAAVALLLSQAALLARLHIPAAPYLRAAGAGGLAGDVSSPGDLGDREAAVESQGDGNQSQGDGDQSQQQSQEMAVLRNVTELAQWAAEIADALRAVFPEMMESRDSFIQHLVQPYQPPPPQDPPAPAGTCAIPQQRDRDARVHAAMARSIEGLAIALACSHSPSQAPHAPNASQSAHPSSTSLTILSLPRSFRRTHCSTATALLPPALPIDTTHTSSSSSSSSRTATQGSKLNPVDPVDPVNSTDPIDRVDDVDLYDAAGRARLARVLIALHQSSSSTWLPPWLSHLLPTWLPPIGRSRSPSTHSYWLGKLAEEWAAQGGEGRGRGGGVRGGGARGAIDLGVEGRLAVGLGQSRPGSQKSQASQGSEGIPAVHGRKGSAASRGSGWWGVTWNSRTSAGKVLMGRGGKDGDGRGREGEGRQWKYFLSAMAFNRAAAASAGSGSERCQAAVFAIFQVGWMEHMRYAGTEHIIWYDRAFCSMWPDMLAPLSRPCSPSCSSLPSHQWIEYMRYAGTEHIYWYDCAAREAESQEAVLSVYTHAGLLTYHRLHQITPPPAGADYHFDQDSSLSHFLQHHGHESKWVAFADVDEYIFMLPDTRPGFLTRLLLRRPCAAQHSAPGAAGRAGRGRREEGEAQQDDQQEATQLLLYNQFFIGYPRPPPARLTIERFIHRPHRPPDHHDRLRGKMLLQPAAALGFLSHAPHRALMHSGETIVADPGLIRVNHYWGDRGLSANASEREREELEDGSVDDRSMQVIADVIKRRLRWVVPVLPVLCERQAVVGAMMEAQRLADVLLQSVQMENG